MAISFPWRKVEVHTDPSKPSVNIDSSQSLPPSVHPPQGDETLILGDPSTSDPSEEATMVAETSPIADPDDEMATLMSDSDVDSDAVTVQSFSRMDSNAATMISSASDAGSEDEKTLLSSPPDAGSEDEKTLISALKSDAESDSESDADFHDHDDPHAPENIKSKRFKKKQPEGVFGVICENLIHQAVSFGVPLLLIRENLLKKEDAMGLLQAAQQRGETFFRSMIMSRSKDQCESIQSWLEQKMTWPLIKDSETLSARAKSTSWLPFDKAFDRGIVALKSGESEVDEFATIDPFDIVLQDWVTTCVGRPIKLFVVSPTIFVPVVRHLKENPERENEDNVGLSIDFSEEEDYLIRENTEDVDVPLMVNYFLYRAHTQGASDIHIEATEQLMVVRNRVDGILHTEISLPMDFHSETVSRLKILGGMDVAEKRRPQDGRLSINVRNNALDVRVSSYPTVFGEKFVLRLLDKNALRPSIDSLGLMDQDLTLIKEKLAAPYGLIMISGPTGSGKTTTLYSCLGGLDKKSKNVLTVEDPVEYRLAGVHQMQVNAKIGLTFASGLRTILRQDPDVIMVGETRDDETAAMAVQAALTGHIVFSTIHTNDAAGVVTRLLDMGIEPFLVATSLSLAVAQRLVRTICQYCRVSVIGHRVLEELAMEGITVSRLESLGIDIDEDMDYVQGAGCDRCRNTGYSGRRAVFELFEMTDEARDIILSGEISMSKLKKLAKEKGMTSLISHGVQLVEEEVTTFAEVVRLLGEDA